MLPVQGTIPDWKTKIPPAPHGDQKLIKQKCVLHLLKKKKKKRTAAIDQCLTMWLHMKITGDF